MRTRLLKVKNIAVMVGTSLALLLAPSASAEFDVVYELTDGFMNSWTWGGSLGTQSSPASVTVRFLGTTENLIHGPVRIVETLDMTFSTLTASSLGQLFVGRMAIRFPPSYHFSNSFTLTDGSVNTNFFALLGGAVVDMTWHCSGASCGSFSWEGQPMSSSVTRALTNDGSPFRVLFYDALTPGSQLQTSFTGIAFGSFNMTAPAPPWFTPKDINALAVRDIRVKEVSRTNVVEEVVQTPSLSGAFVALLMGLLCASAVFWLRRTDATV